MRDTTIYPVLPGRDLPGLPGRQVASKQGIRSAIAQASALLKGAAETLSGDKDTCKCCGLAVYVNWSEFQLKQELETIVRRLDKLQKLNLQTTQPNGRADG